MRLSDVAEAAGVSLATASRVLNGSAQRVSPQLRERVLDAARRLHYVPNAHAQALVRATSSTVGLVVHDVSDPYFSEITRGVFRTARGDELLVLICNTYRDPDTELRYLAALRAQRVHAILLAGSGFASTDLERQSAAELRAYAAVGGRVVVVGRHRSAFDCVQPDNDGGSRAMVRHLLERGHQRIGVIAGPAILTTIEDRLRGVREGLADADLPLPPQRVVYADFNRDGGYAAAMTLLAQAPEVTAIFALNDMMAVGALAALHDRGVRVPRDVSVVGYDDIPIVRDLSPRLTTVRLPMQEMGERAMALALRPAAKQPRRVALPATVIERDSVAPPRRAGRLG